MAKKRWNVYTEVGTAQAAARNAEEDGTSISAYVARLINRDTLSRLLANVPDPDKRAEIERQLAVLL
ncbi:hypothetical protein ACWDTT_33320 [Streptosporangium sandarakinum]